MIGPKESTQRARCVPIPGERDGWWCPQHEGRPRMTLDVYPPYCAECYDEIMGANGDLGRVISFGPSEGLKMSGKQVTYKIGPPQGFCVERRGK